MLDDKKTEYNPTWFLWFLILGPAILIFLVDQIGFVTALAAYCGIGVFSMLLNLWAVHMKDKAGKAA